MYRKNWVIGILISIYFDDFGTSEPLIFKGFRKTETLLQLHPLTGENTVIFAEKFPFTAHKNAIKFPFGIKIIEKIQQSFRLYFIECKKVSV
mgnify:FL=1